ncbi:MAG: YbaK/EbsC family protein [Candidatus Freyarchaeota archaeon]|nr:YbaK/EbsC family protein [Candidatus Jordarchaeia archaeon]MBS7280779.1 YbaK/EbsC family protein [Candidatus Jordarchaeia archaeon]
MSGVKRIKKILENQNIPAEIIELNVKTATSEQAAVALGISTSQIAKSLLLVNESMKPFLVIAPGDKKVDKKRLAEITSSKKVNFADAKLIEEFTGFPMGGVPPFGHINELTTFIDQGLLKHEKVYASGGSDNSLMVIDPKVLIKVTKGRVVDVCI